ncbi:MAG: sulfatase/phosphatase domain-containing protein [Bacteroidota bacterium]
MVLKTNHQSTGWHHVPKHYGVRTNRYKLLHYYESGDWELYDLESDPQEMRNLYGKEAYIDLAVELKEEIVRLQEEYAVPKGT